MKGTDPVRDAVLKAVREDNGLSLVQMGKRVLKELPGLDTAILQSTLDAMVTTGELDYRKYMEGKGQLMRYWLGKGLQERIIERVAAGIDNYNDLAEALAVDKFALKPAVRQLVKDGRLQWREGEFGRLAVVAHEEVEAAHPDEAAAHEPETGGLCVSCLYEVDGKCQSPWPNAEKYAGKEIDGELHECRTGKDQPVTHLEEHPLRWVQCEALYNDAGTERQCENNAYVYGPDGDALCYAHLRAGRGIRNYEEEVTVIREGIPRPDVRRHAAAKLVKCADCGNAKPVKRLSREDVIRVNPEYHLARYRAAEEWYMRMLRIEAPFVRIVGVCHGCGNTVYDNDNGTHGYDLLNDRVYHHSCLEKMHAEHPELLEPEVCADCASHEEPAGCGRMDGCVPSLDDAAECSQKVAVTVEPVVPAKTTQADLSRWVKGLPQRRAAC